MTKFFFHIDIMKEQCYNISEREGAKPLSPPFGLFKLILKHFNQNFYPAYDRYYSDYELFDCVQQVGKLSFCLSLHFLTSCNYIIAHSNVLVKPFLKKIEN